MKNLAQHVSLRVTPQSEPIPGKAQEQNNAGGYAYVLDCWGRLQRFLILGSEGGTYYTGERDLTKQNHAALLQCADQDGSRTVEMVAALSESGRAPKNDPAIFSIAVLCTHHNRITRTLALAAMPRVCRTATHLFQFIGACKELRGWGRGLRNAVAGWYNNKPVDKLAYQVTKYRNRAGYTHRDVLRLSHPKAIDQDHNSLYHWMTKGVFPADFEEQSVCTMDKLRLVFGLDIANSLAPSETKVMVHTIQSYGLTLEHVPNHFLNSSAVWEALLPNLPPTAMIRNLGKMTSVGLLKPLSSATKLVCDTLTNVDRLRGARVHPLSILLAANTYGQGHGIKGSLTWQPVRQVTDALEEAFYSAFDAVESTGKRHLLALDVSGSMGWSFLANTQLSAAKAAACMAMVTHRVEPQTHIVGFSGSLVPIDVSKKERLDSLVSKIDSINFGRTDCAAPMLYALQNRLEVDSFVVYTDNETWAGKIHPSQALRQYRNATGINAKLIVVGMTATEFTIADPSDPGMLDVVGFDASCPSVMADFVR